MISKATYLVPFIKSSSKLRIIRSATYFWHLAALNGSRHMLPLAAVSVQHPYSTKRKYNHAQPELSE